MVVAAGQETPVHHRGAADPGAKSDQGHVLEAAGGAGPVLPEQPWRASFSSRQLQPEGFAAPACEIELAGVLELSLRRGEDAAASRVDDPAETRPKRRYSPRASPRRPRAVSERRPRPSRGSITRLVADAVDQCLVDDAGAVHQRARRVPPPTSITAIPTDHSSIGGEAPARGTNVRAGDRPRQTAAGQPCGVLIDRLLVETIDGEETVAQPDCPRLGTWEVRVPVVVHRPRKQQRLCRSRNLVERRAEMEVPQLDKRGIRAEEHGGRRSRPPIAANDSAVIQLRHAPGSCSASSSIDRPALSNSPPQPADVESGMAKYKACGS